MRGAYDLFINNYGPGRDYASVHVELPDAMTVEEVDNITRRVQRKSMQKPVWSSPAWVFIPIIPGTKRRRGSAIPSWRPS